MNMTSLFHFRYEISEIYLFLLKLMDNCSMIFIHLLTVYREHIFRNNEMGIDDMENRLWLSKLSSLPYNNQ